MRGIFPAAFLRFPQRSFTRPSWSLPRLVRRQRWRRRPWSQSRSRPSSASCSRWIPRKPPRAGPPDETERLQKAARDWRASGGCSGRATPTGRPRASRITVTIPRALRAQPAPRAHRAHGSAQLTSEGARVRHPCLLLAAESRPEVNGIAPRVCLWRPCQCHATLLRTSYLILQQSTALCG